MMKNIILATLASIAILGSKAQQPFQIDGLIHGAQADNCPVYIMKYMDHDYKIVDSAVIEQNRFAFDGTISQPEFVRLIISTGKGEAVKDPSNWLAASFYIDEGKISLEGHIDSLPSYYYRPQKPNVKPVIKGSKAQDLLQEYEASVRPYNKILSELHGLYLEKYHLPSMEDVFHTAEGIAINKATEPLQKRVNQLKWDFILSNSHTVVAFDKAQEYFFGMYTELSVEQMDELISILERHWQGTAAFEQMKATAAISKNTALGAPYVDGQMRDVDGKAVSLSSVFPTDKKYILLEFWASWCGPCRGEIPHLKHTYTEWKDKGFEIISISLDEKDGDWKKAMADEQMTWQQYNLPQGFDAEMAKAYNIAGIPFALLIDSEGKIVRQAMRGASLDLALEELL